MIEKKWRIGTRALHGSGNKNHSKNAHIMPIYQTGSFEQTGSPKDLPINKAYTRFTNPNFEAVEAKIASLECAEASLVFSSGMAAINTVIQRLAASGGHVVCTKTLYGGTYSLFKDILPEMGIEFSFVDTSNPENVRIAMRENTHVVFLETPANPTLILADIKEIAKIAEAHRAYTVVDNSFASPYNQRPIELGADLSIQSVTKYLNGHGDLIMGAVSGRKRLIDSLLYWRKITGPTTTPNDCFLVERGLKTFGIRLERQNKNAWNLAHFLEELDIVKKVHYPGLKSNPQYELAKKQMRTEQGKPGFGGMVVFELEGGMSAARHIVKYFETHETIVSVCMSLGYADTLLQHPASMTHADVPEKERLENGITNGLLRVSVGVEEWEDIEKVFEDAFYNLSN